LTALRVGGPATATALARSLDTNTGATSYHLRKLASVGLAGEAEEGGGVGGGGGGAPPRATVGPSGTGPAIRTPRRQATGCGGTTSGRSWSATSGGLTRRRTRRLTWAEPRESAVPSFGRL